MSTTKYYINKIWYGQYNEEIHFKGAIELNDKVIEAVDNEWRDTFYPDLKTPQQIAEHIAYNIIINNTELSELDGFANFLNSFAVIITE